MGDGMAGGGGVESEGVGFERFSQSWVGENIADYEAGCKQDDYL